MTLDLEKLRAQLDATIVSRSVEAAFQPIVDLRRAEIAGYETLTRLSDQSDFRTPSELFDAAEKTGTLWSLEQLTRRVSLAASAHWKPGAKLFLNTTPQVFSDPRFCSVWASTSLVATGYRSARNFEPGGLVVVDILPASN